MVKIKICGLTALDDVNSVNEAIPDYIGFVFAKSKRQVDFKQAKYLKEALSKQIKSVGIFVNENIDFIKLLSNEGIIDVIQLHGDEDEEYITKIKTIGKPVIKAIRVKNKEDIIEISTDYTLFDTYNKERYGGIGESFLKGEI